MKTKKAPGKDKFVVETLKYGGDSLRKKVYAVVKRMWNRAAEGGSIHDVQWPAEWTVGITVPLYKNKGSRKDKNIYRGITLLSVGSKLLARVVASRLSRWSETFLSDEQNGFRPSRGVDDALTVTRRVAEEANSAKGQQSVRISI